MRNLLILFLTLILISEANAQYYSTCNNYCPPTPTYSQPKAYTPTYEWKQWTTDPNYWVKVTIVDNIISNDGWLYTRSGTYWERHCLISDYKSQVRTVYHEPTYRAITQYPFLNKPGLIVASSPPGSIDLRDFLVPVNEDLALVETASKAQISTTEMALKIAQGEQAKEMEKIKARNQLASFALKSQADERFMSELQKLFALREQAATLSTEKSPADLSQIDAPADLASIVIDSCIGCHGPTKQEAGIDFRAVPADSDIWAEAWISVKTGRMPKNGNKLSDEQVSKFKAHALGK